MNTNSGQDTQLDEQRFEAQCLQGIRDWVASNLAGEVYDIVRLERWRPQWKVSYRTNGESRTVLFRGNRPVAPEESLRFEMETMQVLEAHDIKVPHIYGWVESPTAFVMDWIDTEDRAPGMLHTAIENPSVMTDDRWQAMLSYMDELADVHAVPLAAFKHIERLASPPVGAQDIAMHSVERMYQIGLATKNSDTTIEFLQTWLRCNVPAHRTIPSFISGDAGQFMSAGTEVLALLDFEIADIGDTHWDLAGLRGRHPYENMGDIPALYRRYEKASGKQVDLPVIAYYTVAFLQLAGIAAKLFMAPNSRGGNWIEGVMEYASIMRRALEAIAELRGIALSYDISLPDAQLKPLPESGLKKLLVDIKRLPTSSAFQQWERDLLQAIPQFLLNYARYENWYEREAIADISRVTNRQFDSLAAADEALQKIIDASEPANDPTLVQVLHARALRLSMIIAGTNPDRENPLFHKLDPILNS
ncbi:MAG: hypothetical protein HKO60_10300 [Pseudomonadales bacterium]|nr:hypothetical protein [Pseudomonadales bacterium]